MSAPGLPGAQPEQAGSSGTGRPDWEALAPVWYAMEDGGLNRDLVMRITSLIRPPVLCVGGGAGQLADLVRDRLGGAPVVSLDSSWGMTRRARLRPGLECLVADAVALPFAGQPFTTVLCATGVLEFMSPDERGRALTEMARACRRPGQLLLAGASSDGNVIWDVDQHALVRAWYAHRLPPDSAAGHTFDTVARDVGGRDAAQALLLSSLPRVGRSLTTPMLAETATQAGLKAPQKVMELNGTGVWRVLID